LFCIPFEPPQLFPNPHPLKGYVDSQAFCPDRVHQKFAVPRACQDDDPIAAAKFQQKLL
jgi:hypothetical protein